MTKTAIEVCESEITIVDEPETETEFEKPEVVTKAELITTPPSTPTKQTSQSLDNYIKQEQELQHPSFNYDNLSNNTNDTATETININSLIPQTTLKSSTEEEKPFSSTSTLSSPNEVIKTKVTPSNSQVSTTQKRVTFKLDDVSRKSSTSPAKTTSVSKKEEIKSRSDYIWKEENHSMRLGLSNCVQLLNERFPKNSFVICFCILLNQLILSSYSFTHLTSAAVTLVLGLASFGASFGLRKMYVKALLKIFEYATNIKEEKLKNCEELLDREINDQLEREKEIERIKALRLQSFQLHSGSAARLRHQLEEKLHESEEEHRRRISEERESLEDEDEHLSPPSSEEYEPTLRQRQQNQQQQSHVTIDSGLGSPVSTSAASASSSFHESYSDADLAAKNTSEHVKRDFQLYDICDFVQKGMNAIIDDEVTKRFTTEELTVWNLLSRTNQQYEYVSFRVTVLWLLGFLLRYCVLFPFRLILFLLACFYTFVTTFLIGLLAESPMKRRLNWYGTLMLHRILSRVFSAIITFHNRENRAKSGSICVANHTSPIDVIILSTDSCYSMIGQQHGGFTGMMQRAFSRASTHIWFDRSEAKDRGLVARRMKQHVENKDNLPILIFPEGTCINNTSVMMFKKGCFEVDTTICPVAIKYDLRFGDAFWNSAKHSMLQYLMLMMTSWAIVVDVYYLPPMHRRPDEDAAEFASRVKSVIAKKGGFVDLNWDGMLKRTTPKLDLMYEQQQKYVQQLKID